MMSRKEASPMLTAKETLEEQDGDALRKEVSPMLTTKETLLHKRVCGFIERKR
jgi:hypothetical protein